MPSSPCSHSTLRAIAASVALVASGALAETPFRGPDRPAGSIAVAPRSQEAPASWRSADATARPRHDDAYRPPQPSLATGGPRPVDSYPPSAGRAPYGDAYERYDRGEGGGERRDRYDADRYDRRPEDGGRPREDVYRPRESRAGPREIDERRRIEPYRGDDLAGSRRYDDPLPGDRGDRDFGEPYRSPPAANEREHASNGRYRSEDYGRATVPDEDFDAPGDGRSYSISEIRGAGHRFFGQISGNLASVIEHAFRRAGRPNGYILGEDAGGAFIAGLRYGEGVLHTKNMGNFKVFWQGPSIGYDAGAEGSRVMVLVYNLTDPEEIYDRFAGVAGSAYVIGGVGLTFQGNERVTLAPIRAGVGLRLGANVGYLKYTRRPTWNPF